MSEIKPLGSEKLNGDDKLKRILELTYYNSNNKKSNAKAELVKESKTGGVYGIVKEKDGYYVKRGLNEQSLDYIGGMFMKNKNRFQSYGEAFKRLDFIQGQEELQEGTKYVLKQGGTPPPPQQEAPAPEQTTDVPPTQPTSDTPPPTDGGDQGGSPDNGDGMTGKRSDYMAEIQKYAGKLGQELRDQHERMESDDIKYVLNMIISAINLSKLSPEDKEEISKKFKKSDDMGNDDLEDDSPSNDQDSTSPSPENNELGEEDMNGLKDFVNMSAPHDEHEEKETGGINLKKYTDLGSVHEEEGMEDDVQEIDMDEIKREINQHISGTLSKYFNK